MAQETRIAFVGAGGVNFGSREGPWSHSARLERDENVRFTAIVDPDTELAQRRLRERRLGDYADKWERCQVYASHHELLSSSEQPDVDAVVVGAPASTRGSMNDPGCMMELDLARAGLHLLVEKPLSIRPFTEVAQLAAALEQEARERLLVIAVGYMLRFNTAVEAARAIMQQHNVVPASIVARFSCPYESFARPAWWDTSKSGPCIVEQATHFVDIMRYLAGSDIEMGSVKAVAVGPEMHLSAMPPPPHAEHTVPPEKRNNRATSAVWRFENGAVGSLTHTLLLHGSRLFAEVDIIGDGFHAILSDLYHSPRLLVRRPKASHHEQIELEPSDMYGRQDAAWLEAIRTGDASCVRCPYSDAARTYAASWWITIAANEGRLAN